MATQTDSTMDRTEEFSLFLGGPVYQGLIRVGLIKPPLDRVGWRIIVISMVAWAPLAVLTLVDGRFLSGVKIPFLYDFEAQVRFLVSVPLLIAGELVIHKRMAILVRQFRARQIVTGALQPKFTELIASALRLRNSMAIELGLMALVLLAGGVIWRTVLALESDTWYATLAAGEKALTPAGYWYQFVSVPVVQFLLLRWLFRLLIWWRFLWQVSKLDLNLVPTHPDRSCGLGFLDGIVVAMGPFLLALSCLLSGQLGNRLLYEGGKLPSYYGEMGGLALVLGLLALGPLCVFTPSLLRAKRLGGILYGRLASDYVIGFDRKWIGGERPPEETLLGTADIQSLADLANSFAVVRSIIPFPFGRNSLVALVVIVGLPLVPLLLTMFSLQELAMSLLKLVV